MITRKLKLVVVSENKQAVYAHIRNEVYQQNKALNVAYSHLYFEFVATEKIKDSNEEYLDHLAKYKEMAEQKYAEYMELKKVDDTDEKHKVKVTKAKSEYDKAMERLNKIKNKYSKIAAEVYQSAIGLVKQTRIAKLVKRKFNLHYDTVDRITTRVISDFSNDIGGVLKGERALRTYKKTNPLMVRHRNLKLYQQDGDYFIKWVNGAIFNVIVSVASKQKAKLELRQFLDNLINEHYKMCDSSIEIGNDLILNLSVNMPNYKENLFIPGRKVGVDLGMKIPVFMSLNDNPYIKKSIGTIKDFLDVRTQLQSQRRHRQKSLQITSGGKGREKKLKGLEPLKSKERNFAKTYNHFLSKSIINFALKNNAGIIQLEELKFDKVKHKSLLRNWSYYQLQMMIEDKANREGIKVYYVDARNTSQTCSKCGNLEEGQRLRQDTFACLKCGYKDNADYNASQNIAKSVAL